MATSQARGQLIVLSSSKELERLHGDEADDDLYDLCRYVRTSGVSEVAPKPAASRALGIKPYSTKTETAFLGNPNHALDNVFVAGSRCVVRREVAITIQSPSTCSTSGALTLWYTRKKDDNIRRCSPLGWMAANTGTTPWCRQETRKKPAFARSMALN